jgi:hypothetical protein
MITTVGVFGTHIEARRTIEELHSFGVPTNDISYLYTNTDGEVIDAQSSSKVGEGVTAGATTGAVLGAIAGLVVANGILPGIGTLFVAGPLAAAFGFSGVAAATVAGAATGLAAGGLIGALVNFGISDADAQIYQDFIQKGNVLVIARSDMGTREIFVNNGARQIGIYS